MAGSIREVARDRVFFCPLSKSMSMYTLRVIVIEQILLSTLFLSLVVVGHNHYPPPPPLSFGQTSRSQVGVDNVEA